MDYDYALAHPEEEWLNQAGPAVVPLNAADPVMTKCLAIYFRAPCSKKINSRFLSQQTSYHAV